MLNSFIKQIRLAINLSYIQAQQQLHLNTALR